MMIFAGIAYLIPVSLLLFAWRKTQDLAGLPPWRKAVALSGFVFVCAAMAMDFVFILSWLNNGGSPHGMDPAPGLWSSLRPALKWLFVGAIVLPVSAQRRQRLFLYLAVLFTWGAGSLIYILQME